VPENRNPSRSVRTRRHRSANVESVADTVRPIDNECARVVARQIRHLSADELEAGVALYGERLVQEDRRQGLRSPKREMVGVQSMLEFVRSYRDVGYTRAEHRPIATRGERLALVHIVRSGDAAFEAEHITLYELDDESLIGSIVIFDLEDLDGAVAELDERYRTGGDRGRPSSAG
jgi:hypothetical protein